MATGSQLMKEISDQFLVCKICLEPFKDPKTLSCLHTFCCACVQQQFEAESNRCTRYTLYARAVTCPVCRKRTELPTGGVRRLPDNFLVSNLTEVLAKRRCVSKVPPCEICHTDRPRASEARSKCLDCDKLLCRACVELHSATKVTQDHSLIDLEGQKDIECKAHPEETVRFYCEKCQECVCVVCTFQEHKDHDVCSFNDGLAKHKALLEGLLGRCKDRLQHVDRRLKVIDKVDTVSKEIKDRIRDLAISFTSQVRAREKELVKQVDELFQGEVSQLAEKRSWLQDTLDNLQSACQLTEIVVRDKGVEMLLLKKEIQGKLDHLLSGTLPPEPPDLSQLNVTFVPGDVKLGNIIFPGGGEEKGVQDAGKGNVNDLQAEKATCDSRQTNENIVTASSSPCRTCLKRKRQEEREQRRGEEDRGRKERRKTTKSVYIQTPTQETIADNGHVPNTVPQVSVNSASSRVLVNSAQTQTAAGSSLSAGTGRTRPGHRARGTMTARQDVRTLKVQTEDSCLRDVHQDRAPATRSTCPSTGASVCTQTPGEVDAQTSSLDSPRQAGGVSTHDVQVATDISVSLTSSSADAVTVLLQGEGGSALGVNGSDHGKPDLLAETGRVALPPTSPSSPRIRSRKVQTDKSALDCSCFQEDRCVIDEDMKRAVFVSSGSSSRSQSAGVLNKDPVSSSVTSPLMSASKPSLCDMGVMTSFRVKLMQDAVDRDTMTEAVTSHGVGVMTSLDTRTVYIQTLMKAIKSTASGTDNGGQMSQSTGWPSVSLVDAETTMPQVIHDSRTTWTDTMMTSERATSTTGSETSDAVTLTPQVLTSNVSVQMSPESGEACTNTLPSPVTHQHSQATPSVHSMGTMPETSHLRIPAASSPSSDPYRAEEASLHLPRSAEAGLLCVSVDFVPEETAAARVRSAGREDRGTDTVSVTVTSTATGPDSPKASSRTTSTDTLHLVQVKDNETWTPTVKTAEQWTHTPQPLMVHTGVAPLCPGHLEVGVVTTPLTLTDQATHTEPRTFRDSGTESGLVVCDSETLTEQTLHCDAQTGGEVMTETQGTCTEGGDGEGRAGRPGPARDTQDVESQCQGPWLVHKEVNTTRHRRKAKEVQTSYSYVECLLCQHPEKLDQLAAHKTFTDTSTDPSPPDTHDVATMALSCLASPPGLTHAGVQTSATALYDKGVATSFDFDEDFDSKPCCGLDCQDAATSTESLPYIGLLSEIDVDELIVIPEANFELVSDSDEESVSMVDDETLTEVPDYVEVGTQTLLPASGTVPSPEHVSVFPGHQDDCSKHLVSIGVNTVPKVTFEKETSTPIRHLFSKGTMTFFVAKMDKATSTISQTRQGAAAACGGRVVREAGRQRATDSKVTMTTRTELRDMAVETDSTLVDDRISQCISKLRSVSERLNSPTPRKTVEGEVFFGQSFTTHKPKDASSLTSPTSPKYLRSRTVPPRYSGVLPMSPPRDLSAGEAQRQTQLQSLLAETDAVLKSKEQPGVRKAQPLTTLKTRSPDAPCDLSHYGSKSFPRPRSLDRQNKVKMGSQATSPSRLPLSRYHSAPGRIATVPAQTLLLKTGQTSPRTSPSKIPVSQKPPVLSSSSTTPDSGTDSEPFSTSPTQKVQHSEPFSTSPTQKVQQRPSLPSISETRTPSSCSDTSYVSMESGESSFKPLSVTSVVSVESGKSSIKPLSVTSVVSMESGKPSLSPPPVMTTSVSSARSNMTSVSDSASEAVHSKSSAETLSTEVKGSKEDVSSSVCSTTSASMVTPTSATSSSPSSSGKPKKAKKSLMQRLLPGKKKKDSSKSTLEKTGGSKTEKIPESRQPPAAPLSPQSQKKQAAPSTSLKGARPKKSEKPDVTKSASEGPAPPVSISASSRPTSSDSAQSSTKGGASAVPAASAAAVCTPAMPPHHYPPLPDPSLTPPPPRKPRPFVYVRQRILSIQQDNVEEVTERKEKEKEDKGKEETGKEKEDKQEEETPKEEKGRDKAQEEGEKGKATDKEQPKGAVKKGNKVKGADKKQKARK